MVKRKAQSVSSATAEKPTSKAVAKASNVCVDLGLSELVEFENLGYMPHHAEVRLTASGREAAKRLAVTLDQRGATLSDGSLVKSSVPRAIAWLCERLSDSIQTNRVPEAG